MKNVLVILIGIFFLAAVCPAQNEPELKIQKIAPGVRLVDGRQESKPVGVAAWYSPDGKSLVVSAGAEFCVIPADRLDEALAGSGQRFWWKGQASAFLPSGKVVYTTVRGLYSADPRTGKTAAIYLPPAAEIDEESYYLNGELVVLSENLIVSGDGDYDDLGPRGNILRFDLGRKRRARGPRIAAFFNPHLSPNGRFIAYEYDVMDTEPHAEYYDVARNVNHPLATRFNFRRAFPRYKNTNQRFLGWVGPDTFLAEVTERRDSTGASTGAEAWLVLLNAATGRIVWKRQLGLGETIPYLQQLSPTKMLADHEYEGLFEISLKDGQTTPRPPVRGDKITLSPDKNRIAYFFDKRLFVSALDGTDKKSLFELPKEWELPRGFAQTYARELRWSPDGKRLFIMGDDAFLIVDLDEIA